MFQPANSAHKFRWKGDRVLQTLFRSQAQYCPDPFSIEHITPRSRGGTDAVENLALSCQGCNSRKYTHTEAYDPVTGKLVPLYQPRRQQWADHLINSLVRGACGKHPTSEYLSPT
ncbi:MAG: HNH endonuclease [Drouetiella hepatica Uher 2000/2452]|uniref:HNH endonuclease n=1 Tax=Drouetiella hepatica Uher 2000/2452 TaxID=904376 RepID=A0A951QDA8_9CYAN|nr:HNH endonuclease [Drouetiella hepatica Uher 2000/2452]